MRNVPDIFALRLGKKILYIQDFFIKFIYSINAFNSFDSTSSEVILLLTNRKDKNMYEAGREKSDNYRLNYACVLCTSLYQIRIR